MGYLYDFLKTSADARPGSPTQVGLWANCMWDRRRLVCHLSRQGIKQTNVHAEHDATLITNYTAPDTVSVIISSAREKDPAKVGDSPKPAKTRKRRPKKKTTPKDGQPQPLNARERRISARSGQRAQNDTSAPRQELSSLATTASQLPVESSQATSAPEPVSAPAISPKLGMDEINTIDFFSDRPVSTPGSSTASLNSSISGTPSSIDTDVTIPSPTPKSGRKGPVSTPGSTMSAKFKVTRTRERETPTTATPANNEAGTAPSTAGSPKVFIQSRDTAKRKAHWAVGENISNGKRIVIFTDAGYRKGISSTAVTFKSFLQEQTHVPWVDAWHGVKGINCVTRTEMVAVGQALKTALQELETYRSLGNELSGVQVIVFTDSQSTLTHIQKYLDGTKDIMTQEKSLKDLYQGIDSFKKMEASLELRWCPGHVGVEGNERADALASHAIEEMEKLVRHNPVTSQGQSYEILTLEDIKQQEADEIRKPWDMAFRQIIESELMQRQLRDNERQHQLDSFREEIKQLMELVESAHSRITTTVSDVPVEVEVEARLDQLSKPQPSRLLAGLRKPFVRINNKVKAWRLGSRATSKHHSVLL